MDRNKEVTMEISIVGVGVSVSDRFRSVVEEKSARIEHLSPRAQRLDIKVTHRSYHNGGREDETVEVTLTGKGPVVRAEAVDGDKFAALDLAMTKLGEQIRRAKEKRVDLRNHPRGAKLEKGTGTLQGIDVQPASVDVIRAVATGEVPIITGAEDEEDYTPVVIRTKRFDPEWMTVEDAVDRMELVGHDFFLFIDARTDQPSVVYRRKGWDYGVISLTTTAAPAELAS
ncbi:ribosome-associated translation inhibitor RaiA [Microbacterium oleivorans]|uniref:Ribosome hibernation promoting factor n=2 Tax=Microbacteriaceae TaxID=85023 RepID=A0A4R5YGS2_9MICO|nr:ribosome-associated translation inhibitor RaiA [Microbacterium oleivorans]